MYKVLATVLIILGFTGGYLLGASDTNKRLQPVISSQKTEIRELKYKLVVNQAEYRELDAEFGVLVSKWNNQQAEIAEVNRYDHYVEEQETYTAGSWCNDGTWSPSTGSGTCSWHGGIAR